MATKKRGTYVDPPWANVFPGGSTQFHLMVDGRLEQPDAWTLNDPRAGSIDETGRFTAAEDLRSASTQVIALRKNIVVGLAEARLLYGRALNQPGPVLIDDFQLPGLHTIRWNDPKGRRAALLIQEALAQMPPEFLSAVGEVAVVRVQKLPDEKTGMHLPLLENAVFIADELVVGLDETAQAPTENDQIFVEALVHELAHVALTNAALPPGNRDRLLLVGLTLAALNTAGATGGWSLLVPAGYVYLRYFSPIAQRDVCTDYAEIAGWVINNPDPLGLFWRKLTVRPNVVTGLKLFGQLVGLRNENLLYIPMPAPKDVLPYYQRRGLYSTYARTDVHEDFAESLLAIALDDSFAHAPEFRKRREFILKMGVWPKSWPAIEAGKILAARGAHMNEFAVFFGNYAGKPRYEKPRLIVKQLESAAATSEDESSHRGEGYGTRYPDLDVLADEARLAGALQRITAMQHEIEEEAAPAREIARTEIDALEYPPRGASDVALLRALECHGDGLQAVGAIRPGDLLFDAEAKPYLAVSATRLMGEIRIDGKGRAKMPDLAKLRYAWRPDRHARRDLSAPLIELIQLWGEEEPSAAGAFVAKVLDAHGIRHRNLRGADDEGAIAYLGPRGLQKMPVPLEPGDVVRFRRGRVWGVCTRVREEAADVLVQGTARTPVTLQHGVAVAALSHVWRPRPK